MSLTYRKAFFPFPQVDYLTELTTGVSNANGVLFGAPLSQMTKLYWLGKTWTLAININYSSARTVPGFTQTDTGTLIGSGGNNVDLAMTGPPAYLSPKPPLRVVTPPNLGVFGFPGDSPVSGFTNSGTATSQVTGFPITVTPYSFAKSFSTPPVSLFNQLVTQVSFFAGQLAYVAFDPTAKATCYSRLVSNLFPLGDLIDISLRPDLGGTPLLTGLELKIQDTGVDIVPATTFPIYDYGGIGAATYTSTITGTITLNFDTFWTP